MLRRIKDRFSKPFSSFKGTDDLNLDALLHHAAGSTAHPILYFPTVTGRGSARSSQQSDAPPPLRSAPDIEEGTSKRLIETWEEAMRRQALEDQQRREKDLRVRALVGINDVVYMMCPRLHSRKRVLKSPGVHPHRIVLIIIDHGS
jgi:hypothetical protein